MPNNFQSLTFISFLIFKFIKELPKFSNKTPSARFSCTCFQNVVENQTWISKFGRKRTPFWPGPHSISLMEIHIMNTWGDDYPTMGLKLHTFGKRDFKLYLFGTKGIFFDKFMKLDKNFNKKCLLPHIYAFSGIHSTSTFSKNLVKLNQIWGSTHRYPCFIFYQPYFWGLQDSIH